MPYYITCPICQANLDPGEKCDCATSRFTSDHLLIGYDFGTSDYSVLTIARKKTNAIDILKQYIGKEADEMYKKLTGGL